MGARDRKERKTSFIRISGEVKRSCTVLGFGEGVEATVWRMSPIWQVTAVQGSDPMNEPKKQSFIDTPHTPHATLMPDQGTMPMRRRTESLIQADDFGFSSLVAPSIAFRVISNARGNVFTKNGASGAASRLANIEPKVVKSVSKSVANAGENSAPARTFYV